MRTKKNHAGKCSGSNRNLIPAACTAAQLSDLDFKVFKNYVHVLEGNYFIKLNKTTGKTAVKTQFYWPCKIESQSRKLVISFEGDNGGSMTHAL